jgi:hypothetical protein
MRSCEIDAANEKQNFRATINHEVTGNRVQAVLTYFKAKSYPWPGSA